MRDLRRLGRQAGNASRGLLLLRRPRCGHAVGRHFLDANHLPVVSRQRGHHSPALLGVPRGGLRAPPRDPQSRYPAGVDNGTQLRLHGEGEPSPSGGPPGDCYCVMQVAEHALFHREGQHLVCQVPITYSQAALGTVIEVPTLDGCQELTIDAGTQTGEVFTLRGRGMPDPRHRGRGNLLVQVMIEVPKKLAQRHEELLRELAEIENAHVTPKRKSFVEKLKEYFKPEES